MFTYYLVKILIAVIIMTLYGYIRALVSVKVGDKSGEVKSRLTLNPMEQLDAVGLILFVVFSVGFVKPMKNQVMYSSTRKRDMILIAILPGIILIVLCLALLYLSMFVVYSFGVLPFLPTYLVSALVSSIMLFLYNLIPVYPLDGEKLLYALGSPNLKMKMSEHGNIINILVLMLTFMGIASGLVGLLTQILVNILL